MLRLNKQRARNLDVIKGEWNLFGGVLIGTEAKIIVSSDPTLVGRSGFVEVETKNMLLINDKGKTISIAKNTSSFELDLGGRKITINGSEIVGTPQDRIYKVGGKR
ncbi:MAG: ribonuclease P protein component 1 [Nitrososphaerales archaeon]